MKLDVFNFLSALRLCVCLMTGCVFKRGCVKSETPQVNKAHFLCIIITESCMPGIYAQQCAVIVKRNYAL